jgi:hypothetical protein
MTMAPEIPKRMKAVQLVEINRPYEIREVDVPTNLDPPGKNDSVRGRLHEYESNRVQTSS